MALRRGLWLDFSVWGLLSALFALLLPEPILAQKALPLDIADSISLLDVTSRKGSDRTRQFDVTNNFTIRTMLPSFKLGSGFILDLGLNVQALYFIQELESNVQPNATTFKSVPQYEFRTALRSRELTASYLSTNEFQTTSSNIPGIPINESTNLTNTASIRLILPGYPRLDLNYTASTINQGGKTPISVSSTENIFSGGSYDFATGSIALSRRFLKSKNYINLLENSTITTDASVQNSIPLGDKLTFNTSFSYGEVKRTNLTSPVLGPVTDQTVDLRNGLAGRGFIEGLSYNLNSRYRYTETAQGTGRTVSDERTVTIGYRIPSKVLPQANTTATYSSKIDDTQLSKKSQERGTIELTINPVNNLNMRLVSQLLSKADLLKGIETERESLVSGSLSYNASPQFSLSSNFDTRFSRNPSTGDTATTMGFSGSVNYNPWDWFSVRYGISTNISKNRSGRPGGASFDGENTIYVVEPSLNIAPNLRLNGRYERNVTSSRPGADRDNRNMILNLLWVINQNTQFTLSYNMKEAATGGSPQSDEHSDGITTTLSVTF